MKIAFIGQPNSGKSAIFNYFSGYKSAVSNFPGTTVRYLESQVVFDGQVITCVDLPGVYSITSIDQAELEARNYLLAGDYDVIIDVIDASHLGRSLELTLELLNLEQPLVVALNMMDEAERKGVRIDVPQLSRILEIPVVPTIATAGRGLTDLLQTAINYKPAWVRPEPILFSRDVEQEINNLASRLNPLHPQELGMPQRFMIVKLLENDPHLLKLVRQRHPHCLGLIWEHQNNLAQTHGRSAEKVISSERHALSIDLFEQIARVTPAQKPDWRDILNRISTHKFWGYVLLVLILGLFYQGVFRFGQYTENFLLGYLEEAQKLGRTWLGSQTLAYGLMDGLLTGIFGGVAIVLPYLTPFMVGLAILEDSGYLPRVAFLMDNFMHSLGLHGKSIIPFMLGYGCSVPAVLATRILGNLRDRLVVAILVILIPCSARSVIIFALVAYALGPYYALGVYFFNLLIVGILGRLSTWILPEVSPGILMEIPDFRIPTLANMINKTWLSLKDFMVVAWPILIIGCLVLSLLKFFGLEGYINNAFSPLTALLGLPSQVGSTLVFGIIRKELTLVMLSEAMGTNQLHTVLTHVQLLTFTIFVLFYIPCASTIAALSREIGWKSTALAMVGCFTLALTLGLITRLVGNFIL
jgi:ferrous iron transport protein B